MTNVLGASGARKAVKDSASARIRTDQFGIIVDKRVSEKQTIVKLAFLKIPQQLIGQSSKRLWVIYVLDAIFLYNAISKLKC